MGKYTYFIVQTACASFSRASVHIFHATRTHTRTSTQTAISTFLRGCDGIFFVALTKMRSSRFSGSYIKCTMWTMQAHTYCSVYFVTFWKFNNSNIISTFLRACLLFNTITYFCGQFCLCSCAMRRSTDKNSEMLTPEWFFIWWMEAFYMYECDLWLYSNLINFVNIHFSAALLDSRVYWPFQ